MHSTKEVIVGFSTGVGSAQAFFPDQIEIPAQLGRTADQAVKKLRSANPDIFPEGVEVKTKPYSRPPLGIKFA